MDSHDLGEVSVRGVDMNEVVEAIHGAGGNRSTGVVLANVQLWLVDGVGRAEVAQEFGNVVVGEQADLPVLAHDFGTIVIGNPVAVVRDPLWAGS